MSSEKKAVGGSSFSFTSQLFGTNVDSSSTDIFALFSSNSFQNSQQSEVGGTKSKAFSSYPKSENNFKNKEMKNNNDSTIRSREMSSEHEITTTHPCHFSSSIYYGGQDVYNTTQQPPQTGFNSSLNKHGGEDDSGGASRGNWWQGSLYY